MKIDYTLVLKDLQEQLDGIDERRSALQASIAAIRRLVGEEDQKQLFSSETGKGTDTAKVSLGIPPGFFANKTPTEAYRDLMKLWPGNHRPPRIVDAFLEGGMKGKTRTELLQAVHSVLKREKEKAERNGNGTD